MLSIFLCTTPFNLEYCFTKKSGLFPEMVIMPCERAPLPVGDFQVTLTHSALLRIIAMKVNPLISLFSSKKREQTEAWLVCQNVTDF